MKILVFGNEQVGKTTLIYKFLNQNPPNEFSSTIEERYTFGQGSSKHEICDVCIDLLVYPAYFDLCSAFLIVFDVTQFDTFKAVESHIKLVRCFQNWKPIYIFGNHADQKYTRLISKKQGKFLAFKHNCTYFEGSSGTGRCATKVFNKIVKDFEDRPPPFVRSASIETGLNPRRSRFSLSNISVRFNKQDRLTKSDETDKESTSKKSLLTEIQEDDSCKEKEDEFKNFLQTLPKTLQPQSKTSSYSSQTLQPSRRQLRKTVTFVL